MAVALIDPGYRTPRRSMPRQPPGRRDDRQPGKLRALPTTFRINTGDRRFTHNRIGPLPFRFLAESALKRVAVKTVRPRYAAGAPS
jgi:hypothetical protein